MKKIISLSIIFFSFCLIAAGQTYFASKARLNENSIVKDSSGTVYTYSQWSELIAREDYTIRTVNPNDANSEFLLTKLTEEQKKKRMESMQKPVESRFFKTGKSISNFKTTDINGNKINLKDLKGKVVVLNFWFISCPPCRQEMPALNKLVSEYKDSSNVVFIAVSLDGESDIREFQKKTTFDYTIIDNGRFIANQYGITSFPTNVIVDKEGKVYFHSSGYGFATAHWLGQSIKEILKEE